MFYAEPRDPVSKGDSERAVRCVPPGSADDPGRQGTEEGDRRQEEPRAQRSRLCREHESGGSQGPLRPALQSGTFSITVLIKVHVNTKNRLLSAQLRLTASFSQTERRDEGQNVFCFFFPTGITTFLKLVLCPLVPPPLSG